MNTQQVLTRTLVTRVVGVTYEGRQRVVAQLIKGETIFLVRDPDNLYDPNAIKVMRGTGQQLGYLNRELAARITPILDDQCEGVLRGFVIAVTGGYDQFSNRGVLIRFDLPE
jgi:single-stranded-DNA-specific exonuclease